MPGTPLFEPPPPDAPVTITIKPSGPLLVRGPVVFLDNEGNEVTPPESKTPGVVKLCNCGFSKDRPWCDGSHKR